MYHIANSGIEEAILGSSNFTVRGLGLGSANNNIELNLEVDSSRDRRDLKEWFNQIWNNTDFVEDVKDEMLRYLEQLYGNHAPEFLYFKTPSHIFEQFLTEHDQSGLLLDNTQIVDTQIRMRSSIRRGRRRNRDAAMMIDRNNFPLYLLCRNTWRL